jgi:hypothetical protein
MDDVATKEPGLRRVGLHEGLQHMAGAAVIFVALAFPFHGWAAAGALCGGAVLWVLGYVGLRATHARIWFGTWDALSFAFVWSYAVVLALAIKMLVIQWT